MPQQFCSCALVIGVSATAENQRCCFGGKIRRFMHHKGNLVSLPGVQYINCFHTNTGDGHAQRNSELKKNSNSPRRTSYIMPYRNMWARKSHQKNFGGLPVAPTLRRWAFLLLESKSCGLGLGLSSAILPKAHQVLHPFPPPPHVHSEIP